VVVQDSIKIFTQHFRQQLEVADQLSSSALTGDPDLAQGVAMHRKILYCAMLDSLARVRYEGQKLGNRQRFVRLLRNHTAWPEGHLVSVPILHQRLRATAPAELRSRVQEIIDTGDPNAGTRQPLSAFDQPMRDLLDLAGDDGDSQRKIEKSQHFRLVYSYRCYVVHEFREPGYSMEFFGKGEREPLYHCYRNDPTWRLVYPADFFHRLVEEALSSLQACFTSEGIDPYDAVSDSSGW